MSNAEPSFRTDKYIWLRMQTELDLMSIDEEVSKMPTLLQEGGECSALATEIRDSAKEELERTKATVAAQLRGIQINGKNPSESTIDSLIPTNNEYVAKQQAYANARLDASLWQKLTDALHAKSYSINTAAQLITSGYITRDYIQQKRRQDIRNVQVLK